MQPCFAMSSHPVKSAETSEHFILYFAVPFLQKLNGYPAQTSQVALTRLQPSHSQELEATSLWLQAWGNSFFCLKEYNTMFMHKKLYWVASASLSPEIAPEVDGICLMICSVL